MRRFDRKALRDFYEEQATEVDFQLGLYEVGNKYSVTLNRKRLQTIADWFDKIKNEWAVRTFGDIGTAEGLYLKVAKQTFDEQALVIGCDISLNYLKKAKARTSCGVILCDAEQLPFGDNSLDIVLCTEVLEHLPYPRAAFGELCRISRGFIILSFPADSVFSRIYRLFSSEWRIKNAESAHISGITLKQVKGWAQSSNFMVKEVALSGVLGTVIPQFLRLPLSLYKVADWLVTGFFKNILRLHELATTKMMLLKKAGSMK